MSEVFLIKGLMIHEIARVFTG